MPLLTIHESVVPLEVFKATVTAKNGKIYWELKGSCAPKLNSNLVAQTKKPKQKERWKNPLVLTAKNVLSNPNTHNFYLGLCLSRTDKSLPG